MHCLLKPGLGWERQTVWCQMLDLMKLQAPLTHPHMLLWERHFDDGEGDRSCLLPLPLRHPSHRKLPGTRG